MSLTTNTQIFYTGYKNVFVTSKPENGLISVQPIQGIAMQSLFLIQASGWNVQNGPAMYQFLYQDSVGQLHAFTQFQYSNQIQTMLPPTLKIVVIVKD